MLHIWGLVLIIDSLHLHTNGNNLAISPATTGPYQLSTKQLQHQSFSIQTPRGKIRWECSGRKRNNGLFMVPVTLPRKIDKKTEQMLWIQPLPCQRPHFWFCHPCPQHPDSTTDTLLPKITSMQPVPIFPIFFWLALNIVGLSFI